MPATYPARKCTREHSRRYARTGLHSTLHHVTAQHHAPWCDCTASYTVHDCTTPCSHAYLDDTCLHTCLRICAHTHPRATPADMSAHMSTHMSMYILAQLPFVARLERRAEVFARRQLAIPACMHLSVRASMRASVAGVVRVTARSIHLQSRHLARRKKHSTSINNSFFRSSKSVIFLKCTSGTPVARS